MSSFAALLSEEFIVQPMHATDREGVLRELLHPLRKHHLISSSEKCLETILKRERRMSTGIGKGVALPHGLSSTVADIAMVVGISGEGVDFKAVDGALCHIFLLLVSPAQEPDKHLKILGHVSKLLGDSELRSALMSTHTAGEVLATFTKWEAAHEDLPL